MPHCIEGTVGWEIDPRLETAGSLVIDKPTFGSVRLTEKLSEMDRTTGLESVELVGLCTDICVISNAMLIKAALPEVPVLVDPVCCAGVTPESHDRAVEAMKACQIDIVS